MNQYQHGKHTGDARDLSINKSGRCAGGYEPSAAAAALLGGFAELMEERETY